MRERLKVRRLVRLCVGIAAVLSASAATSANAAIVQTFSTAQSPFPGGAIPLNQGALANNYWSGPYFPQRGPYDVYEEARGSGSHSWFTFDLRSSCAATEVTLQLVRGFEAGPGDLTGGGYTLQEVTTPVEDIYATPFPPDLYGFYLDLGDGPIFGGGGYPLDGAPSDVLSSRLNAAGVAAFNAARGDFFTLGMTGEGGIYLSDSLPPQWNEIFVGVSDPAKLVVTCALPSKKAECKNGGWRNFNVFKNQGDCVSFVATKGTNPPPSRSTG